ncbi:transcriptional repressor [Salipiger mucosus]|uniref:Ferric uptake regulation protein n=1 Tax=Salipiger mucosus DSM 16094 TaxID=1123237 RepID=S9QQW2_9RHOB|nr:transcriptional repressor [Salipiger mucosus]EPX82023.1 Zinc uptake regulation protein ZUR [Salipiger mucosus DSM 16094]
MDPLGFAPHDHGSCIADGLASVERACAAQALSLTPQRRRVLEILLQEHRAMGAYEVLDVLRAEKSGAQPPTVYRALDFLTTHGFAHKIERLNAFVACTHPGERHAPAFLICRTCGTVAEMPSRAIAGAVREAAADLGFLPERMVVEAEGLCPACRERAA